MSAPSGELIPALLPARVAALPPPDDSTPLSARPEAISGASRRLRALSALSGSLTDALHPEDAANLVEQKALSALGAVSAVVVTLGVFPPTQGRAGIRSGGSGPQGGPCHRSPSGAEGARRPVAAERTRPPCRGGT